MTRRPPPPPPRSPAPAARAAEEWFASHGLPWFVESVDARVAALLRPARIAPVVAAGVVAGAAAGAAAGASADDRSTGLLTGVVVALLLLLGYAGGPLRVATMARWAAGRVVSELGLLLPLLTRALPLLLLFMTFLFVNTEVWQVASSLDRAALWGAVGLFALVGVAFLVTRLPEEVRRVERLVAQEGVARACAGTPLADVAAELRLPAAPEPLSRTQRANLVLVLLVAQAFQVVLLAVLVLTFFVLFGLLAISPDVVDSWVQPLFAESVRDVPSPLALFGVTAPAGFPVSNELFQVSLFLSSFAGLYFTVYAVSDATYRAQFFAELDTELEQAVGVRAVYRALDAGADPGAPIR